MAGPVLAWAIHAFISLFPSEHVDARDKPAHDGLPYDLSIYVLGPVLS